VHASEEYVLSTACIQAARSQAICHGLQVCCEQRARLLVGTARQRVHSCGGAARHSVPYNLSQPTAAASVIRGIRPAGSLHHSTALAPRGSCLEIRLAGNCLPSYQMPTSISPPGTPWCQSPPVGRLPAHKGAVDVCGIHGVALRLWAAAWLWRWSAALDVAHVQRVTQEAECVCGGLHSPEGAAGRRLCVWEAGASLGLGGAGVLPYARRSAMQLTCRQIVGRLAQVGSGQWAMGSGQWAVGSGQWAVGRRCGAARAPLPAGRGLLQA
jgi:hypothetical protein